jgi:hypothetical protein
MNLYAEIFVGTLVAAIVIVAVSAFGVLRATLRTKRLSDAVAAHPTLATLRRAQAISAQLSGLQAQVAQIRARSSRIAESAAQLTAVSAIFGLEVDRISFATRLLLGTFIPTLRGSMAD